MSEVLKASDTEVDSMDNFRFPFITNLVWCNADDIFDKNYDITQ